MTNTDKGSISIGELRGGSITDAGGAGGGGHAIVHITKQRGRHWSVHGHAHQGGTVLVPEEALFLMECGALQVLSNGNPLTLQQAYDCLLSKSHLMLYQVYASLKRIGFIATKVNLIYPSRTEPVQQQQGVVDTASQRCGLPSISPACPLCCPAATRNEPSISMLEVWKPAGSRQGNTFRKSQPGPPDFRVILARPEDELPSAEKVEELLSVEPRCPLRVCVVDGASLTYYTLTSPPSPSPSTVDSASLPLQTDVLVDLQ